MSTIKIILNPIAGRGYGARSEPEIRRLLKAEGVAFDLVRTRSHGDAIALAEQAGRDGHQIVVAAGGDGTTHEVVNGLMAAAQGDVAGTLGVIPVGSGSDFANTISIPPDIKGAVRQLAHGETRIIDVCRVTVDDHPPRYFDNTVNVGFGGRVTWEARKVKWVRGMALYLPVVLKTIFLSRTPQITVEYDDETLQGPLAMVCIANGPREGGGFFCTPDAKPDDGLFDLCIVREIGKLAMLGLVPHFMNGSHVDHERVTMTQAKRIVISSSDNLIAHADGEMLCTEARRLIFEILPQRLRVRC